MANGKSEHRRNLRAARRRERAETRELTQRRWARVRRRRGVYGGHDAWTPPTEVSAWVAIKGFLSRALVGFRKR